MDDKAAAGPNQKLSESERKAMDLLAQNRVGQAVAILKREANRRNRQGDEVGAGWDWFTVGGILRPDASKWKEAGKAYERAGQLFHKTGEKRGLMLALLRYAQVMARAGKTDEWVEPARMAMDMARDLDDSEVFTEAMLTAWSGMHALGQDVSDFLDDVMRSGMVDRRIRDQLELVEKGAEGVDKDFEARLLASGDMATLGYFYNRKGMAEFQAGHPDRAIEYLALGRKASADARDVMGYFLNVMGAIMAYQAKDDKSGAVQMLLLGAASLRHVLGQGLDEYFYLIFDGLRSIWGVQEMDRVMGEVTGVLGLEVAKQQDK